MQQSALERDLTSLLEMHNRGSDNALAVPGEYLEIVLRKRSSGAPG